MSQSHCCCFLSACSSLRWIAIAIALGGAGLLYMVFSPVSWLDHFGSNEATQDLGAGVPVTSAIPADPPRPSTPALGDWRSVFLKGFGDSKPGIAEAKAWLDYRDRLHREYDLGEHLSHQFLPLAFAPASLTWHQFVFRVTDPPARPGTTEAAAVSVVALRAAWRAVAAESSNPDAYYALYQALSAPDLPLSPTQRIQSQVVALRQCLSRFPPPETYKKGAGEARPHQVAMALAVAYAGGPEAIDAGRPSGVPLDLPEGILAESELCDGVMAAVIRNGAVDYVKWQDRGRFPVVGGPFLLAVDLMHDMAVLAGKYAAVEWDPKTDSEKLKDLTAHIKSLDENYEKLRKEYEPAIRLGLFNDVRSRVHFALEQHLVGEALRLMTEKGTDLAKEYGKDHVEALLVRAALELATGRTESAAADLRGMPAVFAASTLPAGWREFRQGQGRSMLFQIMFLEGSYRAAGSMYEQMVGAQFRAEPIMTLEEALFNTEFVTGLGTPERAVQIMQLSPLSPLGKLSREMLLSQLLAPFYQRHQKLAAFRTYAAEYAYQRAILALLEGDSATARKFFELARKPAVREWGVPAYSNSTAEFYLRVFQEAEKK